MSIFNELKSSLEEAVEIKQGKKLASRVTKYDVANVKALRATLDVSQQELADALGTSVDTIKSWENKRRNQLIAQQKLQYTSEHLSEPKWHRQ